jgi:hypothetical protein
MKYTTHNTHDVGVSGSCFQGQITCPFSLLVTLFGEPDTGDPSKVDAFWSVLFDDGVTATIYNWKNGRNYCGGPEVEHITKWNIGGYEKAAVDNIKGIMLSGEIAA